MTRLCKEAVADGFDHLKLKVGADIERDVARCALVRGIVGPDIKISIDANQRWGVDEAIANIRRLARFDLWWVEEPTSPDDVLGHRAIAEAIAPVRVATGEHVHNRVMFKQFLASHAIGVCQIDACRVGGVNENVAILLLAAKFGVPVCPHAGGVGLCEVVQHLAMFDYVAVSGSTKTGGSSTSTTCTSTSQIPCRFAAVAIWHPITRAAAPRCCQDPSPNTPIPTARRGPPRRKTSVL